ncbi:MAG: cobalamin B12-binding domain-containing protein [Planctomycetota bacterium]|jgi:methanogenic corrinoid protein MtbC1
MNSRFLERYLAALLEGDRRRARGVIEEALQSGIPANSVYVDIIWPVMVETEELARAGRITAVEEHMGTRINRTIVDQLQNKLPRRPNKARKVVVCCAETEPKELGAQIMADLFESNGWEVRFVGGGLTEDDILDFVNKYAPDVLLVYGTRPKQAPGVRRLIARIRDVNAWPDMRIMVSGGVFNRAEGLWEEIGADLFAETAAKAVEVASKDQGCGGASERELVSGSARKRLRARRGDRVSCVS